MSCMRRSISRQSVVSRFGKRTFRALKAMIKDRQASVRVTPKLTLEARSEARRTPPAPETVEFRDETATS